MILRVPGSRTSRVCYPFARQRRPVPQNRASFEAMWDHCQLLGNLRDEWPLMRSAAREEASSVIASLSGLEGSFGYGK